MPDSKPSTPKPSKTPEIDPKLEARQRVEACSHELRKVLEAFDCQILPALTQKAVGDEPVAELLVAATYVVVPNRR